MAGEHNPADALTRVSNKLLEYYRKIHNREEDEIVAMECMESVNMLPGIII
jgi:hypothetical protein